MTNPFEVLGVAADADDAAIRARYLELVRQYSPEQAPGKFTEIRAAYEAIKDRDTRLNYWLFEAGRKDTVDQVLEELVCRMPRRRLSLAELKKAIGC